MEYGIGLFSADSVYLYSGSEKANNLPQRTLLSINGIQNIDGHEVDRPNYARIGSDVCRRALEVAWEVGKTIR